MWIRKAGILSIVASIAAFAGGCKESKQANEKEPATQAQKSQSSDANTAESQVYARVHWLGKKRISGEKDAASFMGLWNLPESVALEKQTLDKLANAPWRLWLGQTQTNPASALLRPLLDDVVQEESYTELFHATNGPSGACLAIRLTPERALMWQTNLGSVLESSMGLKLTPRAGGWSAKQDARRTLIEFARAGEWTLVSFAHNQNDLQNQSRLLGDFRARIKRDAAPFMKEPKSFWLSGSFTPQSVAEIFSKTWDLRTLQRVSFSFIGEGQDIRTRAQVDFSEPLALELEPWTIPTNMVHDPLESFTAIRGLKPLLKSLTAGQALQDPVLPNQVYFWEQSGAPCLNYWAFQVPGATNALEKLAGLLVEKGNPWLATNGLGRFERAPGDNKVVWSEFFLLKPYLETTVGNGAEFITGGLLAPALTNQPLPAALLQEILPRTNLVSYDWELTGPRIEDLLYISQLARFALHKAQLPGESASLKWMRALESKLGNSGTEVTLAASSQLSLVRKSAGGLTALEIHFLADWLESPEFPKGLYSLVVTNELPLEKRGRTNSIPTRTPGSPER
jgi:hypothetical protein